MFNLTTKDWDSDLSCIVKSGEHPYVVRESVIAYKFAELLTPQHFTRLQTLAPKDYGPVTPELLRRIQQGALDSKETLRYFKTIIKRILGI